MRTEFKIILFGILCAVSIWVAGASLETLSPQGGSFSENLFFKTRPQEFYVFLLTLGIFTLFSFSISLILRQRKQVENKLRASRNYLDRILNAMREEVMLVDRNRRVCDVNECFAERLGFERDEIIGEPCYVTAHGLNEPCQGENGYCPLKQVFEERKVVKAEHIHRDSRGKERVVEIRAFPLFDGEGHVEKMVEVSNEITDEKRMQYELKKSEAKYRGLFDSVRDGIAMVDSGGNIREANPTFLEMLGFSGEQIKNADFWVIVPEKWHKLANKMIETQIMTKGFTDEFEAEYARTDGKIIPVSLKLWAVKSEEGAFNGFWLLTRDISYRKKIEQSQRLTQLGKLVSDMAHEVNNPLMIISGRAELSLLSDPPTKEMEDNLRIIFEQCGRARDIIDRLLKFSRPSKGERKEVAINSLLDSVVNLVEHQFSIANIQIKKNYEELLPSVKVDSKQLEEVFMNLLKNAADAMPQGGTVVISTEREEDNLKIDFIDSGEGIGEEDLKRIFDPFFTTKEKGTGLGLPVCYGIIKNHGGDLRYASKPGKGTTATVLLPLK